MRRLIDISIKLFIGILPLFLFKGHIPTYAQGKFFLMGSFFLYGLGVGTVSIRTLKDDWLRWIYLWLLVCVFFGNDAPHGEWFNFWLSSAGFLYVLAGVMLYTTIYSHAENIKRFLYPIAIVCGLNFILVIAQLSGHDFFWTAAPNICGFFSTENQLSQYSAMSLPLLYCVWPPLIVMPLFTLIASGSLSGCLASLVGLGFLAWHRQMRKSALLFTILSLCIGFVVMNPNLSTKLKTWVFGSRLPMWEKTVNLILHKPYLGYGYQSYDKLMGNDDNFLGGGVYNFGAAKTNSDYTHNGLEFGVPILVLAGLFLLGLWKKFKGKDRLTYFLTASVIIGLSNMCWQNMIRYAAVGGTFVAILALLSIKLRGD